MPAQTKYTMEQALEVCLGWDSDVSDEFFGGGLIFCLLMRKHCLKREYIALDKYFYFIVILLIILLICTAQPF